MAVKKSTRKKVNDPIIDSALRDVYTKLDKLQPSPPNEPYTNLNTPEVGTVTTVEVSGNEAESGTISTAVYTRDGWLVDINSNFKRVGTRGFIASEGTKGRSKIPTQGEALSYDKNRNIKISNSKGDKTLLKNVGGTLQVRDKNDSGDAVIQAKSIGLSDAPAKENSVGLNDGLLTAATLGFALLPGLLAETYTFTADATGTGSPTVTPAEGNANITLNQFVKSDDTPKSGYIPYVNSVTSSGGLVTEFNMGRYNAATFVGENTNAASDGGAITWTTKKSTKATMYLAAEHGDSEIWFNTNGGTLNSWKMGASFFRGRVDSSGDVEANTVPFVIQAYHGNLIDYGAEFELQKNGALTLQGTGAQLLIDTNITSTDAGTHRGLNVNIGKTGASSSTNNLTGVHSVVSNTTATAGVNNAYGMANTVTLQHAADAGATNIYGIKTTTVGSSNGTSTAFGHYLTMSGSDTQVGLYQNLTDGQTDLKFVSSADTDSYFSIATGANGGTTFATNHNGGTTAGITLDIDGGFYIDADRGEARLTDGGSTFTPAHADDLVTKAYVDSVKHTAVWGGALPRIGASGKWYGVPTGYNLAAVQMGTGLSPDTSYTVSTTGDDLVACIWASMHDITVTGCKIWVGQGGANNTAHGVCLMRYDIDADGDLSNGVAVATGGSLDSDDYSQARAHTLTLSVSADDRDVDFSDGQILMAFVEPRSAYNAYMAAKVILEYTEVET